MPSIAATTSGEAPEADAVTSVTATIFGEPSEAVEMLHQLFTEGKLSDVTVCVEKAGEDSKQLPLHKTILEVCCEYFKCMLDGKFKEGNESFVKLQVPEGSSIAAMVQVLQFLYTRHIRLDLDNVMEVLVSADQLQISSLKQGCFEFLEANLSTTCCLSLNASYVFDMPSLREKAAAYIYTHGVSVMRDPMIIHLPKQFLIDWLAGDTLSTSEENVFRGVIAWGEGNKASYSDSLFDALKDIVPLIRFAAMEHAFLMDIVRPTDVVSTDFLLKVMSHKMNRQTSQRDQTSRFGEEEEVGLHCNWKKGLRGRHLKFVSPFDTNGVLYWIGTAAGTRPYKNPQSTGEVVVAASSYLEFSASRITQHTAGGNYNYTDNRADSWISIDLGAAHKLIAKHYCLRSDQHDQNNCKMRSWVLECSNDNESWHLLRSHSQDMSLGDTAFGVADWPLEGTNEPHRYFRIKQTSLNSSGTNYLMCSGIELYGVLIDI